MARHVVAPRGAVAERSAHQTPRMLPRRSLHRRTAHGSPLSGQAGRCTEMRSTVELFEGPAGTDRRRLHCFIALAIAGSLPARQLKLCCSNFLQPRLRRLVLRETIPAVSAQSMAGAPSPPPFERQPAAAASAAAAAACRCCSQTCSPTPPHPCRLSRSHP